jgi:chromosome segregation ATPase
LGQQSSDVNDAELILAVKEQYPDISKAPLRIQNAVAKAERTTPKQLQSGLHKTSHAVGGAAKELKNLKDAKVKHRERWLKHLHDSVQSWEHQLKLYAEQMSNYNMLIKKAKQELNTARQTLEDLNKKAAGHEDADQDTADLEEQNQVDAEAMTMVQQVQQLLQACAKIATKEEVMEVSDAEESTAAPAPKRQRSLEPFGGTPAAAPSDSM